MPNICDRTRRRITVPNLNKCNLQEVFKWVQQQEYPDESSLLDAEAPFVAFCNGLKNAILANCPNKRVGPAPFPSWFTGQLRECIIKKKMLHCRYKKTLKREDYDKFKRVRTQCSALTKKCYSDYISSVDAGLVNNPKTFWSFMGNLKKNSSVPDKFQFEERVAGEPGAICEMFADFFSTVYRTPHTAVPDYNFTSNINLSSIHVSPIEVEAALKSLDPTKGPGPDLISPHILKHCSEVLAPHLSIFFNRMLNQGVFPKNLKTGYLVPLHKSGAQNDVRNYRPIVIQSSMAKLFEKVVLDRITFIFKSIIIPQQHGFQRGRSTTTNLIAFTSNIYTAFSRGGQVDCVYLDFSKAFDRVGHSHLVKKLEALGVTGSLLAWLDSYLTGRTLQVKYASTTSRPISVLSGVPQGSHLGPFLFSLFINDIGRFLDCQFLVFADDVKIFAEVFSESQQLLLQGDLMKIQHWCRTNGMELNASKCVTISFSRTQLIWRFDYKLCDVALKRVNTIRDLGVLLNSTLDFGEHISCIIRRATRVLGLIHRTCRQGFATASIRALFVAHVRPILEFSSVVWAPYQAGHISSIESVQRRLFRVVGLKLGYQYRDVNMVEMSNFLQLPALNARRTYLDLVFLFRILNYLIDCPEILNMISLHIPSSTRNQQLFAKYHQHTNYLYHSAIPRLLRSGNEVCSDVEFFGSSLGVFRRNLFSAISGLRQM